MRQIVLEKCVKFGDPCLNLLQKFRPKPSEAVFSRVFSLRYNFRLEVDNDVICGVATDYVSVDVHVKFGYSGSNGS